MHLRKIPNDQGGAGGPGPLISGKKEEITEKEKPVGQAKQNRPPTPPPFRSRYGSATGV